MTSTLGILCLDTGFTRIPGDIGNPATWPFPTLVRTVPSATPARVVAGRAEGLLDAFVAGAIALVTEGAGAIVTTCGFLVLHQDELQARVPVPVATSALLQIPLAVRMLPAGRRVGVLTASARDLTGAHLAAAGAASDTPVDGPPAGSHFANIFLENTGVLDPDEAERDVVAAAERLVRSHPDIGALVLECANMPPYGQAVRRATGLPIFDMVGLGIWLQGGLQPLAFPRSV